MTLDFERAEAELFDSIKSQAQTNIAKVTVNNVRKACTIMLGSKAPLYYTSVADFIANVDNCEIFEKVQGKIPPKYQSILNNPLLKSIIDFYKFQQMDRIAPVKKDVKAADQYPAEGLDTKTKIYINLLRQQIESLRMENNSLAKVIEDDSKSSPLSLSLSYDAADKQTSASLVLRQDKTVPSLDSIILKKITQLPEDLPDHFQVKSNNQKSALFLCSPSGDKRILSSKEWMHLSKEGESE